MIFSATCSQCYLRYGRHVPLVKVENCTKGLKPWSKSCREEGARSTAELRLRTWHKSSTVASTVASVAEIAADLVQFRLTFASQDLDSSGSRFWDRSIWHVT